MKPEQLKVYLDCLNKAAIGDQVEYVIQHPDQDASSLSDLLIAGRVFASLGTKTDSYRSAKIVGKSKKPPLIAISYGVSVRAYQFLVQGSEYGQTCKYIISVPSIHSHYHFDPDLITKLAGEFPYITQLYYFRTHTICRIIKAI